MRGPDRARRAVSGAIGICRLVVVCNVGPCAEQPGAHDAAGTTNTEARGGAALANGHPLGVYSGCRGRCALAEGLGLALTRLLVPGAVVPSVAAIGPQALRRRGIRALIVDLDNTLTRWNDGECPAETARWLEQVLSAGLGVCIASNNGPRRVQAFCDGLGLSVPWVAHAGKPRPRAYRLCLERLGTPFGSTAAVGDQVFTDVLGGNIAGLFTILVQPLGRREFVGTRALRLVEGVWLHRLRAAGLVTSL